MFVRGSPSVAWPVAPGKQGLAFNGEAAAREAA